MSDRIQSACAVCSKPFKWVKYPSVTDRKCCSRKCSGLLQRKQREILNCPICHASFVKGNDKRSKVETCKNLKCVGEVNKRIIIARSENSPVSKKKACALCLFKVGFGIKSICKMLRTMQAGPMMRWKHEAGIGASSRNPHRFKTGASGRNPACTNGAVHYRDACLHDSRQFRRGDESTHWLNHPEANLWRLRLKWKTDIQFRLRGTLRKSLNKAIKAKRGRSIVQFVGCSIAFLRAHLERNFERSMSWDNHGTVWEIDHVMPQAAFDQSNPKQAAQCWNWMNLRPLSKKENRAKSDTITHPQQSLCLTWGDTPNG